MATKFVTNLDLNQNQILNATLQQLPSPDPAGFLGYMYFNTTNKVVRFYDGTAWKNAITGISTTGANTDAITVTPNTDGTVTISLNLADTDSAGLLSADFWNLLNDATSEATASKLVKRDANGQAKFGAPTDPAHAATKAYVDAARSGLDVKASVKVATTGPLTLSTDLEDGDTVDGYTLVTGDRILVKNQDTASENGIYVVAASGAPTRATDADSSDEVTPGMFTFVEQGTLNADSGWVLITDGAITVGTTGLEFSLFSVAGNILAGEGLSKTGDTLDVNVDGVGIDIVDDEIRLASYTYDGITTTGGTVRVNPAANRGLGFSADVGSPLAVLLNSSDGGLRFDTGGRIELNPTVAGDGLTYTTGVLSVDEVDLAGVTGNGVTGTLPIANGGTNATSAADARTSLAATSPTGADTSTPVLARVASKVIGDGSNTSYTVTHNFGTRAVIVQVFDSSTYDTVIADVVRTTTDSVTISFSVAPASGAFTVVITG